ncbi:unnamed protein product (macronuclear) [Paramecium tetraurelia]|uniref:Chromosome undetermined scaffold_87, whole genome shotgun sequence n=1 Tax=Paramecium tetraurelia TaxID=5888 RepID=Q3SDA4_PARTE|nr:uncharacterized protein GSPATT00025126001 [Paramecium tetraurelia]CAI44459.1 Mini antigen [Paramecium tetraurelia]CAK92392.1 unnamed protein product [Paramecium tetraurelia]|eukprot:XP_001459789.1 hypothetical protein (macronuclear) [Paramecium tetraurelia strain d4-2]
MKIFWAIIVVLPIVLSQTIVVSPSTTCTCQQFLNQSGCNNNTLGQCQWNQKNQVCQQASCGNIQLQSECLISKINCYWNGQSCVDFISCSKLTSKIGLICPQQNVSCYGSNINQCQSISQLPKCSTYKLGTCGQQGGYGGYDGLCAWNNTLQQCVVATSCSQLSDQQVCNTYIQNACIWDYQNLVCTQATCAQLPTQQSCKFVVGNLDPQQVYPCFYNGNQCLDASFELFQNQDQCQTNTLLNYRWVGTQTQGICVSCAQQLFEPANKCACEQFMLQSACNQSQYCQWNQNSCQDIPCSNITNQLQCSNNKKCFWSLQQQNCQVFYSCYQITGLNSLACLAQSINCPNYQQQSCNSSFNSCNQIPQSSCDGYVSNQGVCYWEQSTQACKNLQSCSNIVDEKICNQLTRLCQYSVLLAKCQQLTCQNIKSQKQCTFVFNQLNGTDIQVCEWTNNSCSNAKNILTLNEAQCSYNSQNTYLYTGSKCVKCIQGSLILPEQCTCSQLYLAQDCQANPLCTWNGSCQLANCLSIPNQDVCVQSTHCQWTEFGCSEFQSCILLVGSNPKECISQSINCPYSDGAKCQNKFYYSPCQSYTQPVFCTNQLGTDGLCIWNATSGSCQVLSKCNQILKSTYCGIYQYVCNWSNDSCNQSTCSTYTTPEQCKYYYQSLNSFTPIGCRWNITTSTCEQVGSTLTSYNSANCYTNTAKTARWSQASNQKGVCISCGVKYLPNPLQCNCQQLISQLNCGQNQLCYWDQVSKSCKEYECSVLAENLCITSMKCQWSNKGCITFTSCSQIKGETIDECLSYSLYCPYSPALKSCSTLKNMPKCEEHKTQGVCNSVKRQGKEICFWNQQFDKCTVLKSCYGLSQMDCAYYSLYCAWISTPNYGYCEERKCLNYSTKYSCTYVLSITDANLVQPCQWLNGNCQPLIIAQAKDANTCYVNSNGTSRWTSDSPISGFCVPCNLPSYAVQYQNKCSCSQILNQSECQYPYCSWSNNQCTQNSCSKIYNSLECSQQRQCYWNLNQNQCNTISISVNFCTTLKGSSSLECFAQSINCPGSLYGVCQDSASLQTCSSITTQAACANSIGQEGYCTYDDQACHVISSCLAIKTYIYCVAMQKFCVWNEATNQCFTTTCSNITEKQECTYIYESLNSSSIQLCEWNQATSICQNASSLTLSNKNIESCHIETGGTYHWSNAQPNGYCISCSLDLIKLPNTCSCDQLTSIECLTAKPKCKLVDSTSCVNSQCIDIFDQGNCSTLPYCMWYNQTCVQFTSCSSLSGTTALDCLAQSTNCPAISNGSCKDKKSLGSCSSYLTANECTLGIPSSNGFCYWNNNGCQEMINCDAISQITQCDALYRICSWSAAFNKCVPFKCQNYKNQDQCTFVVVNFKDSYIELCQWQNKVCQQYTEKYYRFDEQTCYQNSGHTYRWVEDEKRGSRCQECYSLLITITMVIYLIAF